MTRYTKRLGLLTVAAATALLVVGVATASAHGRGGAKGVSTSTLVTEAAKQLNVQRADLKAAIVKAAEDRVDAAVADEDITSDEGDQLKADIEDNLNTAYQVSQTSTVAGNLKITTKDLNAGFRAARKALASKAIDTAFANGDITADQATAAKTALDTKTFAGYKSGGIASLGALADAGPGGGGHCGGGPGSNSGTSTDTSTTDTTTSSSSSSSSSSFRVGRR
jgi:hypothetical protein